MIFPMGSSSFGPRDRVRSGGLRNPLWTPRNVLADTVAMLCATSNVRHQAAFARIVVLAGLIWATGEFVAPADAAEPTGESTTASPTPSTESDSLRTYNFGEILILAPGLGVVAEPGMTEIPAAVLEDRDAGSADAIAPLIPSARVGVNSRGEANLTLRGASERQVAIFQDGVRLNIPWDERVDLSLVPIEAMETIRVTRGFGSVLDGPNTLGGVAHFITRGLPENGGRTEALLQGGEAGQLRGSLLHLGRRGDWAYLGAVEHRAEDGFLLPGSFDAEHNQLSDRDLRTNSDRKQRSVLLRLARHLPREGLIGLTVHAMDSEKGVPAEAHLGADERARYWRVPQWRRAIFSLQTDLVPDEERRWRLAGSAALDLFGQDIQDYSDSTYVGTETELAEAIEYGRDRTGLARFRLTRSNDRHRSRNLSFSGSVRYVSHREWEGDQSRDDDRVFAQWLGGVASEWDGQWNEDWRLRVGVGLDLSSTPRTGGREKQDADYEPALGVRISRMVGETSQVHLSGGRRARFPSLRERYSDAAGQFDINPDLDPEVQNSLELGGGWQGETVDWTLGVFGNQLEDGIVRVALDDGVRRRINRDAIRSFGAEASGAWRFAPGWSLEGHHSFLHIRARSAEDDYTLRVERKPSSTSFLSLHGSIARYERFTFALEGQRVGRFYSLDSRTGELVRLSGTEVANLRCQWQWTPSGDRLWGGAVFLRVDNLADKLVLSQLGLPGPGRSLRAGVRLER